MVPTKIRRDVEATAGARSPTIEDTRKRERDIELLLENELTELVALTRRAVELWNLSYPLGIKRSEHAAPPQLSHGRVQTKCNPNQPERDPFQLSPESAPVSGGRD